jgi:hypothetical protein
MECPRPDRYIFDIFKLRRQQFQSAKPRHKTLFSQLNDQCFSIYKGHDSVDSPTPAFPSKVATATLEDVSMNGIVPQLVADAVYLAVPVGSISSLLFSPGSSLWTKPLAAGD